VADSIRFVGNYAGGGYQVALEYNEAMDRVSSETLAAYTISGDTRNFKSVLGDEGRKMILTCPASC